MSNCFKMLFVGLKCLDFCALCVLDPQISAERVRGGSR